MTPHRAREAEIGEILARVEAATGPMSTREIEQCIRLSPWYADDALTKDPLFWNDFCRALQGSMDAALSLVERVLPGWACGFDAGPKTRIAFVDPHDYSDRMFGARHTAEAATPALAILAALLRALSTGAHQ